jgi:hypothetical protein
VRILGVMVVAACGRIGFQAGAGGADAPAGPSCSNGIQDGDETGIDCGGSCLPCVGAACSGNATCATGACINSQCELATGPPFWLPGPDLMSPRWGVACATDAAGTIYATGGEAPGGLATTELLVADTTAFVAGPTMLMPRSTHAVAFTSDGTLYADGGGAGVTAMSLEALVAGTWSPRTGTATGHNQVNGAVGPDDKFYVSDNDFLWVYSPSTDSWASQPTPSNGRDSSGVTRGPDGLIYVIGGRTSLDGVTFVDAFDTGNATWLPRAGLHTSRMYPGTVAAGDGRIYAVGGVQDTTTATATAEAYAPDRWIDVAPTSIARNGVCAAIGADGRIYVAGGSTGVDSTNPIRTVEVYGPVIALSPTTAAPRSTVTVSASNFAANAGVMIAFDGAPVATGTTDATGNATLDFVVPAAASGPHQVVGLDGKSQFPTLAHLTVP